MPQVNNNTPIVDSVRNLDYQVKEQGKVVEALMDFLQVETSWKSTNLSNGRIVVKKIK
jgi:hypothetical protein